MASQGLAQGMPPAQVVTATVEEGAIAPTTQYVGTVYFAEISHVASEVEGKVLSVDIRDGQRVAKGQKLVVLSSDFLAKRIANAQALLEQAQADYQYAKLNSERITKLYKTQTVHAGEYDDARLDELALRKKLVALEATVDRLKLEREKKVIHAPFDGVVLERQVFRGDWVSAGQSVAVVGLAGEFDVTFNVPAKVFQESRPGMDVDVYCAGSTYKGQILAAIAMGDTATRSFPVKVRIRAQSGLAEGMEARANVPTGPVTQAMIIPRDAVISPRGSTVVVAVVDGKATHMPVQVVGYRGLEAGVLSPMLKPGMEVVAKGNERLRPGQPVAPKPKK